MKIFAFLPFLFLLSCGDDTSSENESVEVGTDTTTELEEFTDEELGEIPEELELMDEVMFSDPIQKEVIVCRIGQYQDIAVMVLNHYSDDGLMIEPIDGYYFYLKHHKNLDLKGQMSFHPYYYSLNEYYKGNQSGFMEFAIDLEDVNESFPNYWTTNRTNGERQKFTAEKIISGAPNEIKVDIVNTRYELVHNVADMTLPDGENLTEVSDYMNTTLINDEYLVFEYDVLRTNYHMGGIDGMAKRTAPNTYYFEGEEGCKLTLTTSGKEITVEDDNTCGYYGGANVYFSGTLKKIK